jgi:hypothetical protein
MRRVRRIAAALVLLASPAAADEPGRTVLLFVPELRGAVTFGFEARSALERVPIAGEPSVPPTSVLGHLGYRLYLDPHTRALLGAYLEVGGTGEQPDRTAVTNLDFGVELMARAVSRDFFFGGLGLFGEAGPVFLRQSPPENVEARTGLRWAAGLESDLGMLWYLDPYLLADVAGRVGVESVTAAGTRFVSLFASLRVTFDVAMTRGAP